VPYDLSLFPLPFPDECIGPCTDLAVVLQNMWVPGFTGQAMKARTSLAQALASETDVGVLAVASSGWGGTWRRGGGRCPRATPSPSSPGQRLSWEYV
jgi:hypothetical protein